MTIKDVAKATGYGIGTVSRVINNHPDVSEKAREKILKVIDEMGYEPNENAKMLKSRNGNVFGVIIKGNRSMLFADMLEVIQAALETIHENVSIDYIDEDADEVEEALHMSRLISPRGIFFLGANLSNYDDRFDQIRVPCVILSADARNLTRYSNLSSVFVDDQQAAYEMMKYIVSEGHRTIGILGGALAPTQMSYYRMKGCLQCLEEENISFSLEENYGVCRYSMEDGYRAAKKLLSGNHSLTAVLCFSDTIALGAVRAVRDMGLRVPEDVSVVGFDGIEMARYSVPRITTIDQNAAAIAQKGVEIMLMKSHYPGSGEHVLIPHSFSAGESVKRI